MSDRVTPSQVGQRISVLLWIGGFIFAEFMTWGQPRGKVLSLGALLLLIPFGCIEKLCSIMNLVAMERDWVGHGRAAFELS